MGHELTNEELEQLDMLMGTLRVDIDVEQPVWRSKPLLRKTGVELPLEHEAASESFLVAEMEGRVKLSEETRLLEEKRLKQRSHKRKRYARRGRFHHKTKEATKRKRNLKAWADDPLTRIRHSFRQGVDIRQDEWQRLLEPVWRMHPTESLRLRQDSGRGGPLHIYNIIVTAGRASGPKVVVYNGPNQAITDSMDSAYVDRLMELTGPRKG
jgi:hypothetical protein